MPPTRPAPHDPFTTSSHASSASTRTRRQRQEQQQQQQQQPPPPPPSSQPAPPPIPSFAPVPPRRPTTKPPTRVVDDTVLPDSEAEEPDTAAPARYRQRRIRHGAAPNDSRHHHHHHHHARGLLRPARHQVVEPDFVNRDATGNYLLGSAGSSMPLGTLTSGEGEEDEEVAHQRQLDLYYAELARKYFAKGVHLGDGQSRHSEDGYERDRHEMMALLRQEVVEKLENERWIYENGHSG